jgi:uncharacterized protein with HEPN domain
MDERDLTRLRHMRDAAQEVVAFTQGNTRSSLDTDRLLVRGLSMSIGIIGEAASKLSQEIHNANSQIPWPQIIGMRNRLIHAYFEVDLDILWKVATEEVSLLIEQLNQIIASGENEP